MSVAALLDEILILVLVRPLELTSAKIFRSSDIYIDFLLGSNIFFAIYVNINRVCSDIRPRTLTVSRSKQFSENEVSSSSRMKRKLLHYINFSVLLRGVFTF